MLVLMSFFMLVSFLMLMAFLVLVRIFMLVSDLMIMPLSVTTIYACQFHSIEHSWFFAC